MTILSPEMKLLEKYANGSSRERTLCTFKFNPYICILIDFHNFFIRFFIKKSVTLKVMLPEYSISVSQRAKVSE